LRGEAEAIQRSAASGPVVLLDRFASARDDGGRASKAIDGEVGDEDERRCARSIRSRRNVMTAPVVILVEPQLAENIGMTARAMANFGLSELRLVAPKNGWPKKGVREAASGSVA
jgi:SpoU rRNA Methylase family